MIDPVSRYPSSIGEIVVLYEQCNQLVDIRFANLTQQAEDFRFAVTDDSAAPNPINSL